MFCSTRFFRDVAIVELFPCGMVASTLVIFRIRCLFYVFLARVYSKTSSVVLFVFSDFLSDEDFVLLVLK